MYPCIVAHTDTNQDYHDSLELAQIGNILLGWDKVNAQQVGAGFDDKVGILIALQCLEHFSTLKVFFPTLEEVGYVGTRAANMSFFDNVSYCIQPDRNSFNNDLITFTNGLETAGEDFVQALDFHGLLSKFSYEEADGIGTDIGELKRRGLSCSAVNISCGYYKEHSNQEVCSVVHLHNALNFIIEIIECLGSEKFEHINKWEDSVGMFGGQGMYSSDDLGKKPAWSRLSPLNLLWSKVTDEEEIMYLDYEHCPECREELEWLIPKSYYTNEGERFKCNICKSEYYLGYEAKSNKTNKGRDTISGLW
jgi:hypothetical protein